MFTDKSQTDGHVDQLRGFKSQQRNPEDNHLTPGMQSFADGKGQQRGHYTKSCTLWVRQAEAFAMQRTEHG